MKKLIVLLFSLMLLHVPGVWAGGGESHYAGLPCVDCHHEGSIAFSITPIDEFDSEFYDADWAGINQSLIDDIQAEMSRLSLESGSFEPLLDDMGGDWLAPYSLP